MSGSFPVPPSVRPIPTPTGSTLLVGSTRTYTTIQDAINAASNGDRLLLDPETFTITSTINVNKSVTIEGQGMGVTTVITTTITVTFMFNITVSDVVFLNMSLIQNFPSVLSVETVIALNGLSETGIYIDDCEISVCEIGVSIKATEFQITNCSFNYAPLASPNNGNYYILISSTSGQSIIDSNTFVSVSGPTRSRFVIITNIAVSSGTLQGSLLISNNTQLASPFTLRHLLVMEEYIGTNFELFIVSNTTILEGNVPVLLYNANFTIFKFIAVYNNHAQNTAGKGFIGIDSSSAGTTDIYSSNNTITDQFFTAGWASATVPTSFIVGYDATVILVNPDVPLIPLTTEVQDKLVVDITLKALQKQQLTVSTTPPTRVKVPIVLAELTLHISLDDSFTLPVPSAEIKSMENRLELTQCLLALPGNVLFLTGFVRKNIQYVMMGEPWIAPEEIEVANYTTDVPFSLTTDLTGTYINPPVLPSMNIRAELGFFTSSPLPMSVPHPSKDRLLAGDLAQFDQQSEEFLTELPYCELVSVEFVDYVEALG